MWMTLSMDSFLKGIRAMSITAQEAARSLAAAFAGMTKTMSGFSGTLKKDTKIVAHKGETIQIKPREGI